MENKTVSASVDFQVEFYDVDSMNIVWHGNYVKYMERARCALLSKLRYDYAAMEKSGFAFPVVDIHVKYIRPLRFLQKVRITATIVEYENCLKLAYKIEDLETGMVLTKAESMQMAVDLKTMESQFVSPKVFLDKVEYYLKNGEADA
ncbi:MAG: acyl-CoA thioesterase [Fibrobacter sp.]|jgi:acyl-CoA thioester hydrolase|nr:acyl-CoA thioesterase [Fibrobacter sp.]